MTRGKIELVRRVFLRPLAAAAMIGMTFGGAGFSHAQGSSVLRLAVAGGESDMSMATMRGIDLGIAEARHAAALFRKTLERIDARDCLASGPAQLLVYAGDPDRAGSVSAQCASRGIVFINAIASADSLRERCSRFIYHVAASDSMGRTAVASAGRRGTAEMWDKSLERFGAGQLNDRYRQTGGEMGSAEWAGWISVKIAWEAFLRSPANSSSAIADWLSRDATHFDGHKGAPLSFRSWDHQLRQPMYVLVEGSPLAEVPSLSRPGVPMRDLLDSLAGAQGDRRCD
jgi:hypothetical protein